MCSRACHRLGGLMLPLALLCAGCGGGDTVLCYVGSTMRPVIEHLARVYAEQTGQAVTIDCADSGGLLIKIRQTQQGDLYICHDPFAAALERDDLAHRMWTVAALTPMIAVPKGNPRKITGLASLAEPGIRLGLTHATYSSLGHVNPIMFEKTGLADKIQANATLETRTGDGAVQAILTGKTDAAIVWDATVAAGSDTLDAVGIEPQFHPAAVDAVTSATFGVVDVSSIKVTAATLKCSEKVEAATQFAEFIASEAGRRAFAAYGFSPAPSPAP